LPGASGATPAIWGETIFVSSTDQNRNLLLLCLDRPTGKVRWQQMLVEAGNAEKGRNNSASPSPVTDGKTVYVLYGSSDLVALDFDGKIIWRRNLGKDYGKFAINWIYGSSPLLFNGKLYVQVLQQTPAPANYPGIGADVGPRESYILALEPATGKTIWKQLRPSTAIVEAMESYATPTPHFGTDGKVQLLIAGGDCVTGHDPETGEELWRGYGLNRQHQQFMRLVPSPVSAAGLAIACGPKKEQMVAFRTDLKGDITEKGLVWTFDEKKTPDVCTPAVFDGKLFALDGDSSTLTCLDPKTGQKKWQGNLGDRTVIRSSPTAADGKLYIINEKNTVFICSTGDSFEILSKISMGDAEGTRASIAVADKDLYIRTPATLYCVGK
ncbi:MAG TPA: PQQ-binding-like beta-propeller repeat protein, partial [Chthoniobacteraceae bacterium]